MGKVTINQGAVNEFATSPEMEAFLRMAAEAGAEGARQRVPVDTGRLHDSIESSYENGVSRYHSNVDYDLDVEFGTRDTPAQPFLRPALDDVRRAIQ